MYLDLAFSSSAIRRICKNRNAAVSLLGAEAAAFLHARLADIAAAETGMDLKLLPGIFELDDDVGSVFVKVGAHVVLSAQQGHLSTPRDSLGKINWGDVMRVKVLEVGEQK